MTGRDMSTDFEDDGASFRVRRERFVGAIYASTPLFLQKAKIPKGLVFWPMLLIALFGVVFLATVAITIIVAVLGL